MQLVVGRRLGSDHRDVRQVEDAEVAGQAHRQVDAQRVERVLVAEVVADQRLVPRDAHRRGSCRARYPASRPARFRRTHSVRSATTGSSRPARRAGATPKKMPTAADTANASTGDHQAMTAGSGDTAATSRDDADAEPDADQAADHAEQHRLDEELQQDVALPGAERLAQPDLAGPLPDADQHDVRDADAADEQRDRGDRGEHQGEQPEDAPDGAEDLGLGDGRELLAVVLVLQGRDQPSSAAARRRRRAAP